MTNRQYPYIPNDNPDVRRQMLDFIGVDSVEESYSFLPKHLLSGDPLDIPPAFVSEMDLKSHVQQVLSQNQTCEEYSSFLGAGCYNHYVPAVCDEINGRSEFLTAYSGDTYADYGKLQTFFEFTSMMGELLNLYVVSFPTYDGGQAAATAVLMAHRITGRNRTLIPTSFSPHLLTQLRCACEGIAFETIACLDNGQVDLEDLKAKLNESVCCVLLQNPTFLGFFEEQASEIGRLTHQAGAKFVVYADPATLGIIAPPADYGADICCGDIQPLGIHMSYGGGLGGYLATPQQEEYILNYPHHLYSLFVNSKGQYGYARALPERTSYYVREEAVEYLGTCVGLWAITAATYLAVMGPQGMRELGEDIVAKSAYAAQKLSALPGVQHLFSESKSFQEFVLNFDRTNKTVAYVNQELLKRRIFGGYDLSRVMPELGQSMLVCVTEKTTVGDIDALAAALKQIL